MKNAAIKIFIVLIITNVSLLLNGCQRQNSNQRSEQLISIALGSAPSSVNPVTSTDATGMRLVSLVYQGLVQVGEGLKPIPDLAYKWLEKENQLTFYIKKSSKFSDGSPVTCNDLISSIGMFQAEKCPFRSVFKNISKPNCSTQEGDLVLSFLLNGLVDKFLLADLPVLKIKKGDLGSGPFVLTKNDPTQSILDPNPHSPQEESYSLKLFYLKDDFARFLKVYKGDIDIAPNSIPFEKFSSFKDSKFKLLEQTYLSTSYLLINFKNKKMKNLDLRKKIYDEIGISDLVTNRFDNHVTLAKSLLAPVHPYFSQNLLTIKHKNYKLEKTPPLLILKTSNLRQSRETGKIIAQKLRAANIPVLLQSFERGTFFKDVKNGNYDLALMKWVGVLDPDLYNLAFHSSEFTPGRNRGYYSNSKLDKLLDQARNAKEINVRMQIYNQVQDLVYKNLAIIPLWHENQIHIVHPRISGYKLNPMGSFQSFLKLEVKNKKEI